MARFQINRLRDHATPPSPDASMRRLCALHAKLAGQEKMKCLETLSPHPALLSSIPPEHYTISISVSGTRRRVAFSSARASPIR